MTLVGRLAGLRCRASCLPGVSHHGLAGRLGGNTDVHVPKRDEEEAGPLLESGHEALFVVVFVHGGLANLAKAAAAPLHEVHALEEVGEHRVSAQARDALREHVLGDPSAFEHGTRRG